MPECPTCGRDDFDSVKGMKVHHTLSHGESIAGVLLECEYCGSDFRRFEAHVRDDLDHDFCGQDCLGAWLSENKSGEDSALFKGITADCDNCGEPTGKKPVRIERSRYDYCSVGCAAEHRRGRYSRVDHPLSKSVYVECHTCGNEVVKPQRDIERFDHHFCDVNCMGEWKAKVQSGENNPVWKGGEYTYGPGWNEGKKSKVRERDGYRCQSCGRSQEKNIELTGRKLPVHHIQSARSFDDPEKRNAMDNLVTVCHSCHKDWDAMSPLRPQTV